MQWYLDWSTHCDASCYVPVCFGALQRDEEFLIVLEDLDAGGYPSRKSQLTAVEVKLCLKWLANFHASFINEKPQGLWAEGTYWHLATRPDELAAMESGALKDAAQCLNDKLANCQYQTFVHGDAKLENFCFSADGTKVAAVDFQYVGGGCGIKDVAYFLGSCIDEASLQASDDEFLEGYFIELKAALKLRDKAVDFAALENEWRELYAVAWTDFYRFLSGWMPGHKKINDYTRQLAQKVLGKL